MDCATWILLYNVWKIPHLNPLSTLGYGYVSGSRLDHKVRQSTRSHADWDMRGVVQKLASEKETDVATILRQEEQVTNLKHALQRSMGETEQVSRELDDAKVKVKAAQQAREALVQEVCRITVHLYLASPILTLLQKPYCTLICCVLSSLGGLEQTTVIVTLSHHLFYHLPVNSTTVGIFSFLTPYGL
jgi:hypothetical protein